MKRSIHILPLLAILAAFTAPAFPVDDPNSGGIGRTTERELKVTLSSAFGSVYISRGESEKIFVSDQLPGKKDVPGISVDYSIRNRIGYMDILLGEEQEESSHGDKIVHVGNIKSGKWFLKFTDNVPISFDVELGVGKGVFDLTGMQIKDFNLNAGASDVSLSFDEANKTSIDNINIESGVSRFVGRNLGNANFKHFRFQGGVGAYELDFSGALQNEADVDVEVGFGAVTIYVPQQVGAKIFYDESWVSRIDCEKAFEKTSENEYTTENYSTAQGKLNLRVSSGLGAVKVRRK